MQPQQAKFLAFHVHHSRDSEAYRQLYKAYRDVILRLLASKLPRQEDVDEIASEVFLKGWEYMTANVVEYPQALFIKIARNHVADFYRKGHQELIEPLTDALVDTIASPRSLREDTETHERMTETLARIRRLKEEYRDVIRLRFIEQRSIEEVANILGKTQNGIHVLIHRARSALKKIM